MRDLNIQEYIGSEHDSVAELMKRLNEMSIRILFIVDDNHCLIGALTDGDVRRFILSGGKIDDSSNMACNMMPVKANTIEEAAKIFKSKYLAIPIVNDDNQIEDIYFGTKNTKVYKKIHVPVVINAGGRGTRLDPYTKVLPKPLIPVGELPIIELIMQEYQKYECSDFHIIVNYKKDLMKTYFRESENQYKISWYDEEKPLGTGGGLSLLRGKMHSTFFFANCDALLTADYESMMSFHKEQGNTITMICAIKNVNIPYGVVEMGEQGIIESMKEKPMISFLANTGIYIVEPEVIYDIEDDEEIGFPDIVEREKKKGKKVAVFPVSENDWMDMGQLPELEKMRVKLYGE